MIRTTEVKLIDSTTNLISALEYVISVAHNEGLRQFGLDTDYLVDEINKAKASL